jgi:lipopolysaccharide transport system ATP-binding protein
MSDIAIRVEGLGKKYRIGKRQASYGTLRDSVTETFAKPFRAARSLMTRNGNGHSDSGLTSDFRSLTTDSDFWALKDVSFEVPRGEVVGIIGRNGAGKSTLLKILSRITEPTTGAVDIYGRVGSLLEVGTGFHPELSGRENIYLNGAILGLKQTELNRKLDEIVAFAESDQFLDTPVKRYSSGMYLRLAFAVAAHLESEILLVDEVLAVGDAEFQNKCLGKMGDVAKEGRTVLFVSHNIGAINDLCSRCILLERGSIKADGETETVTHRYLSGCSSKSSEVTFALGGKEVAFDSLALNDENGVINSVFDVTKPISVRMRFTLRQATPGLHVGLAVFNDRGDRIFYHSHAYAERALVVDRAGTHEIVARIPGNLLVPGAYSINAALLRPNVELYDLREHVLAFDLEETRSGRYEFSGRDLGYVLADVKWQLLS